MLSANTNPWRALCWEQILVMSERLKTWCGTVNEMVVLVEQQTPELLV